MVRVVLLGFQLGSLKPKKNPRTFKTWRFEHGLHILHMHASVKSMRGQVVPHF